MAFVLCETHGGAVAPIACSHIAVLVRSHVTITPPFYVWAEYLDELAWAVNLCVECANKYGFTDPVTKLVGEEGMDRIFGIEDQLPVCNACFEECCPNRHRRLD